MAIKLRNQNPAVGDTINLGLITYNSNNFSNVASIIQVSIYYLDPNACTEENPDGRTLVQTIPGSQVIQQDVGNYLLPLVTSAPSYVIGRYLDVWDIVFETNDQITHKENKFEIFPSLWYVSTLPAVYSFSFQFQPNRFRKNSISWLIIKIIPNVPKATELERYYTNLAISADMTISVERNCGPCPQTCDADILIDDDPVNVRDKVFGYYKIDASDTGPGFECGIYDVWFTLNYADTVNISPKYQIQIY